MAARPEVALIDMGVGEPDGMAYPGVVNALSEQAAMPENRGYSDNGLPEFKEAVAQYMARVYGVDLDPESEITHAVGAKNALAFLPTCFINPGDAVIATVPGYPVLGTHSRWYGGDVYNLPLLEENDYLPDLNSLTAEQLQKAKILLFNYPNNPTGAVATPEFFEEVVAFARQHKLLVVQDAAYAAPGVRRAAAELPFHPGRERGRCRNPQHVQGLQHDRLAAGLDLRQRIGGTGFRRHQGQL